MSVVGADGLMQLFAAAIRTVEADAADKILQVGAERIRDRARSELGIYQAATGMFNAWDQLAPATLARKSGNTPLYETGALEAAIKVIPSGEPLTIYVGITDPDMAVIGKTQEFGSLTKNIPPRPFLGPALYQEEEQIRADIDALVFSGFGTSGGYGK